VLELVVQSTALVVARYLSGLEETAFRYMGF